MTSPTKIVWVLLHELNDLQMPGTYLKLYHEAGEVQGIQLDLLVLHYEVEDLHIDN